MGATVRIGKRLVQVINSIVNFIVLVMVLLLILYSCYALWDSSRVYGTADAAQYAVYKPGADETDGGPSFGDLQAINPEVFSWLTVYGTNIDYPVVQSQDRDNMKYVSINAQGEYAASGSIFLDAMNRSDFTDFNSIIYGHHMEKQAMFGEIGLFSEEAFFAERLYGNLYYGGLDHGLEFFAFLHVDAYDISVFSPAVSGEQAEQHYLENLLAKATFVRDIGVTTKDRIVLLSTCSTSSTNGRDMLAARITDEQFVNPFAAAGGSVTAYAIQATVDGQTDPFSGIPVLLWILLLIFAALLILAIVFRRRHKRRDAEADADAA